MTTLGIIGAGKIGTNVAKAAIAAGYDVVLSNSRGPASLEATIQDLAPKASAATPEQAAAAGDLILVAVQLIDYTQVPVEPLAGKVVMDATNYHPQRYGRIEALDTNASTTSELLQAHLPESRVVKAFNTITYDQIPADATPAGTSNRRALPIAGDDALAKNTVAEFLNTIGYDSVDIGPLADSWKVERDTPAYGKRTNAQELRDLTANVERVQQR